MKLGSVIKKCRISRDITLEMLSDKTGLSKSYLSLIENDKREASLESLENISLSLGVPLYIILYMAADKSKLKEIDQKLRVDLDKFIDKLINE